MAEAKDPAKARWLAIVAVRWTGVVLVVLGLLVQSGRIALPPVVGIVFVLVGLFDAFVMPVFLARRWKTKA
jgi:hypothetical protein